MQPVFLLTDLVFYALLLGCLIYAILALRDRHLKHKWLLALRRPVAMVSTMVLLMFLLIAAIDSLHYRKALPVVPGEKIIYGTEVLSPLDEILSPLVKSRERGYSAPLAVYGFRKETVEIDGRSVRDYPRLKFGGAHLKDPEQEWFSDVMQSTLIAFFLACAFVFFTTYLVLLSSAYMQKISFNMMWSRFIQGQTDWPSRTMVLTACLIAIVISWVVVLSEHYHVFGTDSTGNSVLVMALKSIRTALVIGSLTSLVVLPLALILGVVAGYFRGWVDELIQYIYTLLASIPDVLMIAAGVLLLQVAIDNNQSLFVTAIERSDARLFFLCLILGITSFTGMCRLVRGETLKLREMEYIQSAQAFGVPTWQILSRHIVPNLMHLVLISTVMQFSGFVLVEAVLSYVGVGVDPQTASFGVMINTSRAELANTPVVWWSLTTAFVFMFFIVLSAILLADAIREVFDPRAAISEVSAKAGLVSTAKNSSAP